MDNVPNLKGERSGSERLPQLRR